MMGKNISLNIHYRPQLLVGMVLGVWLYFFLFLIGPFDAAELSLAIRSFLMLGYGLIVFLSYALLIPLQNKLYQYWGKWTIGYELSLVVLFCGFCLPVSFAYYKTEAVNGTFSFIDFALQVYLPITAILAPVIFAGRYMVARIASTKPATDEGIGKKTLTLLGENKLDILKLPMSGLVAIEAANNYVAVYFLLDGQLRKKLLRTSLRKIHQTVPEMIQVHRSYLVNAQHFIEWKDGLTLSLTQISVPVSQRYKSTLMDMPAFVPK